MPARRAGHRHLVSSSGPPRRAAVLLAALIAVVMLAAPTASAGPAEAPARSGDPAWSSGPVQSADPASSNDPARFADPARSADLRPAAPPSQDPDALAALELESIGPVALAPGEVLSAEITITNTSSEPITRPRLEARTRTPRVTDRAVLQEWQGEAAPDTDGEPVGRSMEAATLAPQDSTTVTVAVPAEQLGYSLSPDLWGPRRLSFTLVSGEDPLMSLRTFTVWRPEGTTSTISQSVLTPVIPPDPAQMIQNPEGFRQSAEDGALHRMQQVALDEDVDWLLEPSLVFPPRDLQSAGQQEAPAEEPGGEATAPAAPEAAPTQYAVHPAAQDYARSLVDAVGERTVLSTPYARTDMVSLEQAGAEQLHQHADVAARAAWSAVGIEPPARTLTIPGAQADGDALLAALEADAGALVVPSASLRSDPVDSATPSSIGIFRSDGQEIPVIAPDGGLSQEMSGLVEGADAEQTRQRLLAETATIAAQDLPTRQHLVVMPQITGQTDPQAMTAAMEDFRQAPWLQQARTAELLDAANTMEWTSDPLGEPGQLFAIAEVTPGQVQPSAPDQQGVWRHLSEAEQPQLIDEELIAELEDTAARLTNLTTIMEDPAPVEAPMHLALGAAGVHNRGDPETAAAQGEAARERTQEIADSVSVVPASGYNLVSDAAGVPITVTNELAVPVTVDMEVSADRPVVRIGETAPVQVPAGGQADITVPVEAVANGTVTLTTVLTTADGTPLSEPVEAPLNVNPAWENWTTVVLAIAMGALVVIGVLRARRTHSSTRAPGVRGPEDPGELARTGRSQPAGRGEESPGVGEEAPGHGEEGAGREGAPHEEGPR